ncbi:MAG: metal-dependent transcriptional regulator [Ignavibacteria bacterium]|nr:metal-dependent transcriptional regulator [Ignavibacteria bacterium]
MPSQSKEDYLKKIYILQEQGNKVNTGILASAMGVSPASVSEMVNKLSDLRWIKNEPYHGFKLTREGEKLSVNLIRKHRLLEVFLSEHLNYKWEEVHEEAEKIEHTVSDKFINKLEEYLGFPKFDPHGDPIPDRNGKFETMNYKVLTSAEKGRKYIVARVNDVSREILKYLTSIGLKLNSRIEILEKIDYDGSVEIMINNRKHLLSKKMAEYIFVM